MLSDELAIERLERAYDLAMSQYGGGMYCFDPVEEMQNTIAESGAKPKMLIPGKTDAFGVPMDDRR